MGDIRVDLKGLEEFRDKIQKVADEAGRQAFMESCAKELAARLLTKVIKRTPVGDYSDTYDLEDDGQQKFLVMSDKQGGTLRRGWTTHKAGSGAEGLGSDNVLEFVEGLKVNHFADTYVIEVRNDVEYASYVEFGHRTRGGKGWVAGQYFLTLSERDLERVAPAVLEKELEKLLRRVFNV